MESRDQGRHAAAQASAALTEAESARAKFARDIVVPSWFFTSMGMAIAAQIATTAVVAGLGEPTATGLVVLVAGVLVFAVVAVVQLLRFRTLNGVWIGGLSSRVVFGTATGASVSYAAALGLALWAAIAELWLVVGLCAIGGGAAYALSGRRWLARYRREPEELSKGESWQFILLATAIAVVGLAVLVQSA